jgi:hypothetical protein
MSRRRPARGRQRFNQVRTVVCSPGDGEAASGLRNGFWPGHKNGAPKDASLLGGTLR